MSGPTVLFIGGYGRSGSTLLERVLGEVPGVRALGEVRHLWREGLVENRRCGCGALFADCPDWRAVMRRGFGESGVDGPAIRGLQQQVDRWWRVPALARPPASRRLQRYVDALAALYRAAAETSGARVLVDSSKDVSHGYVLHHLPPDIDVRTLHLVRDARATAFSWQRLKDNPGSGRPMERWPAWRTALEWTLINAGVRASRHLGRPYLRLRYEEFAADPAVALRRVLEFAGLPDAAVPVGGDGDVDLGAGHTVAGNPDRFRAGVTTIRADRRWHSQLATRDRRIVTALSAASLRRYGYPLAGPGPSLVEVDETRALSAS